MHRMAAAIIHFDPVAALAAFMPFPFTPISFPQHFGVFTFEVHDPHTSIAIFHRNRKYMRERFSFFQKVWPLNYFRFIPAFFLWPNLLSPAFFLFLLKRKKKAVFHASRSSFAISPERPIALLLCVIAFVLTMLFAPALRIFS